jgi:hypothetical protein
VDIPSGVLHSGTKLIDTVLGLEGVKNVRELRPLLQRK